MVILLWWSLFHNVEITSIVAETYNLNTFPSDFFCLTSRSFIGYTMADKNKDRFYYDSKFIGSPDGRVLRILAEYFGPLQRFRRNKIADTIVFFGSARIKSQEEAQQALKNAPKNISKKKKDQLKRDLKMSRYYEDSRKLAYKLTKWSKRLKEKRRRFIITSGGGPGIMEAANRGAHNVGGKSIGLGISLPFEQGVNEYIPKNLQFEFHYFFVRKFYFLYHAKALVVFPGGFGTMDELFESLTLLQTRKLEKNLPIVLYDKEFWDSIVDFDQFVRWGVVSPEDLELFSFADDVDSAFEQVVAGLQTHHLQAP